MGRRLAIEKPPIQKKIKKIKTRIIISFSKKLHNIGLDPS
jgi:hypothetical protein